VIAVTGFEDPALGGDEAHAECVGIGLRELWDVRGDFAFIKGDVRRMEIVDERLHFVRRSGCGHMSWARCLEGSSGRDSNFCSQVPDVPATG
jgi:hypothetical protein